MPGADREIYRAGDSEYELDWNRGLMAEPTSVAVVQIPSDYTSVRVKMESADGSSVEIDCST